MKQFINQTNAKETLVKQDTHSKQKGKKKPNRENEDLPQWVKSTVVLIEVSPIGVKSFGIIIFWLLVIGSFFGLGDNNLFETIFLALLGAFKK
jgi:hypothetical protein